MTATYSRSPGWALAAVHACGGARHPPVGGVGLADPGKAPVAAGVHAKGVQAHSAYAVGVEPGVPLGLSNREGGGIPGQRLLPDAARAPVAVQCP